MDKLKTIRSIGITRKINEIIDWINNQEKIIPTQTPNPQSNEGFDLKNSMNEFLNNHFGIPNGDQQIVLSQFRHWFKNQANGETPVEDNTVGQVDNVLNILYKASENLGDGNFLNTRWNINDAIKELKIINKPVETTKEQPKYSFELKNINATDFPMRITNLSTKEIREYAVEGLPWKMMNEFDSEIIHYIFTHFKSDTKIG